MKDLWRMLGYTAGAVVVILLLIQVGTAKIPAGMEIVLALLLVVIVPLLLAIALSRRKKKDDAA